MGLKWRSHGWLLDLWLERLYGSWYKLVNINNVLIFNMEKKVLMNSLYVMLKLKFLEMAKRNFSFSVLPLKSEYLINVIIFIVFFFFDFFILPSGILRIC